MSEVSFFHSDESIETNFRSIFLLGANTATYKFALAKSLLELKENNKTFVSLDELSPFFSKHLVEHIKQNKKQLVGKGTSKLLNALYLYSQEQISEDLMLNVTKNEGFKIVLDAFHNLPKRQRSISFFEKAVQDKKKGIILTDSLFQLLDSSDYENFFNEIEGRWNLVESAWSENHLINVQYDTNTEQLYYLKPVSNNSFLHSHLRTNLTPVRKPLNGYQKGKCFYCNKSISIESNKKNTCDVDHVIPMSIQYASKYDLQLNEVWNLVLACQECNRWEQGGKAGNVPLKKYILALNKRNEWLIESNHPLKENIIFKTGKTSEKRIDYLLKRFEIACDIRKESWSPKYTYKD
ncbi:HNH endonuclease [Acinetobacter sp. HY1485]|uniref:HNH endonuclease n=1 Tax=Acinetobacter sp. HY1485 TaxID=2970918 RepID=UPI0022B9983B|nr:HNH endonuclease signature motif containing protein [Acinetobacter sp. HY1485]